MNLSHHLFKLVVGFRAFFGPIHSQFLLHFFDLILEPDHIITIIDFVWSLEELYISFYRVLKVSNLFMMRQMPRCRIFKVSSMGLVYFISSFHDQLFSHIVKQPHEPFFLVHFDHFLLMFDALNYFFLHTVPSYKVMLIFNLKFDF